MVINRIQPDASPSHRARGPEPLVLCRNPRPSISAACIVLVEWIRLARHERHSRGELKPHPSAQWDILWAPLMRTGRKVLAAAAIAVGVLFTLLVIREAFFGYTAYFVIIPGAKVFVYGKPSAGWLHRGGRGQFLILTRSVSGRRESYLISRLDEKGAHVHSCGDWAAPRFPVVAIGDINPPCSSIVVLNNEPGPKVALPNRALIFRERSVEFTADDSGRVKTTW